MRAQLRKELRAKKRVPLDFERGACYAFYAILSCDIHVQIENSEQGRKSLKKLAKMVKISGNDEQKHGAAYRHDGGQRRRAERLAQLGERRRGVTPRGGSLPIIRNPKGEPSQMIFGSFGAAPPFSAASGRHRPKRNLPAVCLQADFHSFIGASIVRPVRPSRGKAQPLNRGLPCAPCCRR